eukprot:2064716-Lingulodinium_polyedra.AAC.1
METALGKAFVEHFRAKHFPGAIYSLEDGNMFQAMAEAMAAPEVRGDSDDDLEADMDTLRADATG